MLFQGHGPAGFTSQHRRPCCVELFRKVSFGPAAVPPFSRRRTIRIAAAGSVRQQAASPLYHSKNHELPRRAVLTSLLGILQLASPAYGADPALPLTPAPAPGEQASPGAAAKPLTDRGPPGSSKSATVIAGDAANTNQRVSSAKESTTSAPSPAPAPEGPQPSRRVPQDAPPSPADSSPKMPSAERVPMPGGNGSTPKAAPKPMDESERETKRLLDEEEERRKTRRRKKGRIRELEEIRAELAEKELVLLGKEQELLERDQTVAVLREELELEKKLRTLLTKEKEKAEEEAALAMGLCTGGSIF